MGTCYLEWAPIKRDNVKIMAGSARHGLLSLGAKCGKTKLAKGTRRDLTYFAVYTVVHLTNLAYLTYGCNQQYCALCQSVCACSDAVKRVIAFGQ